MPMITDHHEFFESDIKPKHSTNNHPAGNKVFSASVSLCITSTAAESTITATAVKERNITATAVQRKFYNCNCSPKQVL